MINSLVHNINIPEDWINTFLLNWTNSCIISWDRIHMIGKDFGVKTTSNHNWRIMGAQLNRYLLKGYVGHKSNRKKNCREATAYIGYKSQHQFLCGIQRSISIQVLKWKQKLISDKMFIKWKKIKTPQNTPFPLRLNTKENSSFHHECFLKPRKANLVLQGVGSWTQWSLRVPYNLKILYDFNCEIPFD